MNTSSSLLRIILPPATLLIAGLLAACSPPAAPPPELPSVFVSAVHNDSGAIARVLAGSLRPRVESELSFRAGGRVTARAVEVGQTVRAGQVLGRIDAVDYQLAVQAASEQQRAAEVDAAQAASDAARFKRLLADDSVGAADAERQQARADAAAARLAQARHQTEVTRNRAGHAILTAPFDGIVTALRFETGQVVADGQSVLSLAGPGELELQADIPETLAVGLREWQATASLGVGEPGAGGAEGSRAGSNGREIALKLRELAPSASTASRTFRARYALAAPLPAGTPWRMGMTATLRLVQPGHLPGAELPVSALLVTGVPAAAAAAAGASAPSAPGRTAAVWLVQSETGALQRTPVQLLSQSTGQVRVAGLPEGALVVSVGAQKLDAGMKVRPVPRPLDEALTRGSASGPTSQPVALR